MNEDEEDEENEEIKKRPCIYLSDQSRKFLQPLVEPGYSLSGEINRIIGSYERMISAAAKRVKERFSEGEISAYCDANNGCWLLDVDATQGAWANVADSADFSEKWDLPGDNMELAMKIRGAPLEEQYALAEINRRFWGGGKYQTATIMDVVEELIKE